jgi:acetate kinase
MISDTGFYATLPDRARKYALPATLRDELGLRWLGFYGLAHESMVRPWHAMASPPDLEAARPISFHFAFGLLGHGDAGQEPGYFKGYTPLEGRHDNAGPRSGHCTPLDAARA